MEGTIEGRGKLRELIHADKACSEKRQAARRQRRAAWQEAERLRQQLSKAAERFEKVMEEEAHWRRALGRAAEGAGALRAESAMLSQSLDGSAADAASTALALRSVGGALQQIRAQCAELEAERSDLLNTMGAVHKDVEGVRRETEMRKELEAMVAARAMMAEEGAGASADEVWKLPEGQTAAVADLEAARRSVRQLRESIHRMDVQCVELRHEVGGLESRTREVLRAKELVRQRSLALEAEQGIVKNGGTGRPPPVHPATASDGWQMHH